MLGAAHPRRVGLQERPDQAQVQGSPPPPAFALFIAGAALPAATTPALGRLPGPHRHHDGLLSIVEIHALHDDFTNPRSRAHNLAERTLFPSPSLNARRSPPTVPAVEGWNRG